MLSFTPSEDEINMRADQFIASKISAYTRSSLEKLFDKQLVFLNDKPLRASYKVKNEDQITVDDELLKKQPDPISIPIIYEDIDVTVLDKPEGVLSHSKGALNDESTVASFIKARLNDDLGNTNRAGIVHRLDRATSGVIITAKNKSVLSHLQKQFSQRRTKKTYMAIVSGVPKEESAVIDVPLERNPNRPQTFRVGANGKPAVTQYRITQTFVHKNRSYSCLELKPQTGRTHQLRVHLQYIGHPIVGDRIYNGEPADHLFLHAKQLELTLPSGERKIFESKMPDYFSEFLNAK